MIVPGYFEDLQTLHVGTQPPRAYFIPASARRDDLVEHRERSDRFQLLNGEWDFRYYASIRDLEDAFYLPQYEPAGYAPIPVPSAWQNQGYDLHHYTNVKFPFPIDPPYVPYENPCGCYRHHFTYHKQAGAPRAYLNFEGVDSCFYLWLNGSFVGYSQVSHSTSEFDVTDLLCEGDNLLAVLVLKWCDGSYLEDQDKFRSSGIFRDVYLLLRPEQHIRDYFVTTALQDDAAEVLVRFSFRGAVPVCLRLLDGQGTVVAEGTAQPAQQKDEYSHCAALTVPSPVLWNPERPYLYTLLLETADEVITEQVGLRSICIRDNVVYLNGSPIKFRGVNRHDSDPVTGPVISVEYMKRDLRLIREHNFNAIRTSHYPNAPMFCQLCDRYGFMVIDEADNESHGANERYCIGNDVWENHVEHWNEPFANNPDFMEATLDRTRLCVQRDKNRPSVLIWSMGNECAYGCCFEAALAWTKQFDPGRLTHFESAAYHDHTRTYDFSNLDLYSGMYYALDRLQAYLDKQPDKPFVLCEYAHAMGNGPGDLEDYWQMFEANPTLCGGFVWEWCDHAVYKGQSPAGKAMYWYGGDHGEYPHDGNFCVDGLVYPDRRVSTGLLECKNVNRPVRAVAYDQQQGRLTLHNYRDFVPMNEDVVLHWQLNCDGAAVHSGCIRQLPAIAPHAEGCVPLKLEIPPHGSCQLKVSYCLKKATELLPKGYELGFDEIALRNEDSRNQTALRLWNARPTRGQGLCVQESERWLTIEGSGFVYRYGKGTGLFHGMQLQGKQLLDRPMELNIWRAPTDNDRKLKQEWFAARYDHSITRCYGTEYTLEKEGTMLHIHSTASVSAVSMQRILTVTLDWTVTADGAVTVQVCAMRDLQCPQLPRFGLRLFVPQCLQQASWYGLGPMENYPDKCRAASHGLYREAVANLHEDYIRPQENGSRACDYVVLEGGGLRLAVVGSKRFSFNASPYTQEQLAETAHNYELQPCGSTVLCLDYRQNGIGSNSCGPELLQKYRLDEQVLEFALRLIPEAE